MPIFANPYPKAHEEESPMKKQGPPRRPKSKRGPKKEMQGKAIYSKTQIYCIIQFPNRMASADKNKLGPNPFWYSQHYLAHKGPNSFV